MAREIIDLTGQVFGLVTVESRAGTDANGKTTWNIVCQCGQRREMAGHALKDRPPSTHIGCKKAKWAARERAFLAEREQGK